MRLSEAEWKVMGVVWNRSPINAREILEQLGGETDWAYSTVKTLLTRLAEKGAVTITLRGNTRWFEAAVSRDRARRSELRSLLDRAFDGTFGSLVQHLARAEELSDEDRKTLERIAFEEESGAAPEGEEGGGEGNDP